jgi:nucleoside-diphosphate-sugar epimerase
MRNQRIVITGGAGFIGSHLTSTLLEMGNDVVVVDILLRGNKIPKEVQSKIEFHQVDVRDSEAMAKICKGAHLIFHFAAILGVDL